MVLGSREQGAEEKHFRELGRKVIFLSGSREQRPPPPGGASTLLAWLLIQDKKSTRLNSIVSSPKQLLAAIMFNKTRLNWCEFIGSRSFSTKNKLHQNCISFHFDKDLFTFDVISVINTTSSELKHGTRLLNR